MSHDARAYLTTGNGEKKYAVSGTFEDGEWQSLGNFVEYAKDLQGIELVKQGGSAKLNINYNAESGLNWSVELPPEDQILVLLHRLRPFVLNK